MEYLKKLMGSVINLDRLGSETTELNYFLEEYKPATKVQKDTVDAASSQVISLSIAGVCVGFACALSLRRYMPGIFGDISPTRCLVDVSLTFAGYSMFAYVGMEAALERLRDIRRDLLFQGYQKPDFLVYLGNSEYVAHLQERLKLYPKAYGSQAEFYYELMKPSEYEKWINEKKDSETGNQQQL